MNKEIPKRNRKSNRAKRNQTALLCSICLIVIIACISSGYGFPSSAEESSSSFKYYTEIRVSRNMTLWDIAQRYITKEYDSCESYIDEVKEINGVYEDAIYYGQYLTIPYYSTEVK